MILDELEIFGIPKVQEQAILASILCGEPCLLIGPPGSAKTELINVLGAALREDSRRTNPKDPSKWFSTQVYDASKLNFEDLFGFPSPADLQKDPPEVSYISTQSTIWGKHMVGLDELNRCAEDRQSNLFEIIRSRKLHGIPTGNKFIFSTINPFGDQGTIAMSDALVDRHLFYIRLGKFDEMSSYERKKVIGRLGQVDGVGLRYWGDYVGGLDVDSTQINEKLADIGQKLRNLLTSAMKYHTKLIESIGPSVIEIIDKIVGAFAADFKKEKPNIQKECAISGRRASSILRGILAVRAIQLVSKEENQEVEDVMSTIINTIKLCLPIGIASTLDENIISRADQLVDTTVKSLWPSIKGSKSTVDIDRMSEALSTGNPLRILDILLSVNINKITRDAIFGHLLDKDRYTNNNTKVLDENAYNTMQVLLFKLDKEIPGFVPSHLKLTITAEEVVEMSKEEEVDCNKEFLSFAEIIENIKEKLKPFPTALFAYKTALIYYADRAENDEEIIRAIIDMQRLVNLIKTKFEINNSNEEPKTKSKKKSDGDNKAS